MTHITLKWTFLQFQNIYILVFKSAKNKQKNYKLPMTRDSVCWVKSKLINRIIIGENKNNQQTRSCWI
jgi:hypothetical protein